MKTSISPQTIMQSILLSFFLLTFFAFASYAQPPGNGYVTEPTMPTPNAVSLGKYADIPVDYSTGVPNISIPIYTVTEGDLSLPISLSYHASGVKVGEPASWVGLGWSLNAGGMIIRQVQGLPDDQQGGWLYLTVSDLAYETGLDFFPCSSGPTLEEIGPNWYDIIHGLIDSESDVYCFNVGGYTGKFYFEIGGEVKLVPEQDIKIEYEGYSPNQTGEGSKFTLTTPDGVKYYFGDIGDGNYAIDAQKVSAPGISYYTPSSWYLKKIESADNYHSIDFQYEEEYYTYWNLINRTNTNGSSTPPPNSPSEMNTLVHGFRLSSISTTLHNVNFSAVNIRKDLKADPSYPSLPAKSLNSISIQSGDYCKKFVFSYDYFEDNSSYKTNEEEDLRLKLGSVQEMSCDQSIQIPAYTFEYLGKENNINFLPNRLSKAIDHWGYYNGADQNNDYSNVYNIPFIYEECFYVPSPNLPCQDLCINAGYNIDRNPNANTSKWGTLQKIGLPTGGYQEFDFENHEYEGLETKIIKIDVYNQTFPPTCGWSLVAYYTFELSAYELPNTYIDVQDGGKCDDYNSEFIVQLYRINEDNSRTLINSTGVSTSLCEGPPLLSEKFPGIQPYTPYELKVKTLNRKSSSVRIFTTEEETDYTEVAGGLRIKSIAAHSNASPPVIRTYEYMDDTKSSAHLLNKPKYYDVISYSACNGGVTNETYYLNEGSTLPLYSFEGRHIVYSKVTERFADNGSKVFSFSIEDEPTIYPCGFEAEYSSQMIFDFPLDFVQPQILTGQLENEDIRDANGNSLASNSSLPYNDAYSYSSTCMMKVASWGSNNIKTYRIRTRPYRIGQTINVLDGVTKTTTYEYNNSEYLFPSAMQFNNSDGKIHRTEYTYSFERPNESVWDKMRDRYMVGIVVETKNKVDGVEVSGSKTDYELFDGNPYPETFSSYFPPSWRLKGTVNSYYDGTDPDGKGKPKKYTANGWNAQEFKWTDGLLAENKFLGDNSGGDFITSYTYYDSTSFLERVTNIDGTISEFDYDPLMRLSVEKSKFASGGFGVMTSHSYQIGGGNNQISSATDFADGTPSQSAVQEFDGLGRPTITRINGVVKEDLLYDPEGRIIKKIYLPGTYTELGYEPSPLNRVITETYPDDSGIAKAYGSQGNYYSFGITDENGHTTITLTDILDRTKSVTDAMGNVTEYSYYDAGQLKEVRPPNWQTGGSYTYGYDQFYRLASKTIPAGGTQNFGYNERDLVVLFQDANLAENNLWIATNYDVYGRAFNTGFVGGLPGNLNSIDITPSNLLTETFYDNPNNAASLPVTTPGSSDCNSARAKGKVVGTAIRILDSDNWIYSKTCYDVFGRSIANNSSNHLGGEDQFISNLNLADLPEETERYHTGSGSGVNIFEDFTYDNSLRIERTRHKIDGEPWNVISRNYYNIADQVIQKRIGGIGETGGQGYLQDIDYRYNLRGWLTHINEVEGIK